MLNELLALLKAHGHSKNHALSDFHLLFTQANARQVTYFKAKHSDKHYIGLGQCRKLSSYDDHLEQEEMAFGGSFFEYSDHAHCQTNDHWSGFTPFHYIVPQVTLSFGHGCIEVLTGIKHLDTFYHQSPSGIKKIESIHVNAHDFSRWCKQVNTVTAALDHHKTKVVLSRHIQQEIEPHKSTRHMFINLMEKMPHCHYFYMRPQEETCFISLTPETLLNKKSHELIVDTIAGTRPRGATQEEDFRNEKELTSSHKERQEHNIVLETIKENMKPYGEVCNEQTTVMKLTNVMHLYTPVTVKLHPHSSLSQLVSDLHPTPAVGGSPKDWAMQMIGTLEDSMRGLYAAPIGMLSPKEQILAVGIRSVLIQNNNATIFGGCGIVKESDPKQEWDEINHKVQFIVDELSKKPEQIRRKNDKEKNHDGTVL